MHERGVATKPYKLAHEDGTTIKGAMARASDRITRTPPFLLACAEAPRPKASAEGSGVLSVALYPYTCTHLDGGHSHRRAVFSSHQLARGGKHVEAWHRALANPAVESGSLEGAQKQ